MAHILIVDDDDAFRESLAETLGDWGTTPPKRVAVTMR